MDRPEEGERPNHDIEGGPLMGEKAPAAPPRSPDTLVGADDLTWMKPPLSARPLPPPDEEMGPLPLDALFEDDGA